MKQYSVEQTVDFVCDSEGFIAKPYKDTAGVWTIGHGLTYLAGEPVSKLTKPITEAQSKKIVALRLLNLVKEIEPKLQVDLEDCQAAAILSMAYNIGLNALLTSTFFKRINEGASNESIIEAGFRYHKVTVPGVTPKSLKPDKGLVNRREKELLLYFTGDDNSQQIVREQGLLLRKLCK